jgi:hypothetical protein
MSAEVRMSEPGSTVPEDQLPAEHREGFLQAAEVQKSPLFKWGGTYPLPDARGEVQALHIRVNAGLTFIPEDPRTKSATAYATAWVLVILGSISLMSAGFLGQCSRLTLRRSWGQGSGGRAGLDPRGPLGPSRAAARLGLAREGLIEDEDGIPIWYLEDGGRIGRKEVGMFGGVERELELAAGR